jgi:hypothetical protein
MDAFINTTIVFYRSHVIYKDTDLVIENESILADSIDPERRLGGMLGIVPVTSSHVVSTLPIVALQVANVFRNNSTKLPNSEFMPT